MDGLKSLFHTKRLRTRLILWFLLISLLPLSWITFISYEFSKKMLLDQASSNLQALSLRQAQQIENYFEEKERDIISFGKGFVVPEALQTLKESLQKFGKNSPEYQEINQKFRSILAIRTEALRYYDLFLLDNDGTIVFSLTSPEAVGANVLKNGSPYAPLSLLFENAKDFLQTGISNFISYGSTDSLAAFISFPILNGSISGVVIAQIDNSSIYKLLTDYNGLGKTGETILVMETDEGLISIGPLRNGQTHDPMQIIPSNSPFGEFILQVLNGQRLTDTLKDYHGEDTLMVGRYFLPGLNWAIITKIDTKELLAPINKLKFLSFIMAFATAGIVILTASNVARAIAYPILALTRKTKLMAAGDLLQRIKVDSDDEFGRLGRSFNDMASQLDTMVKNLDTIVSKRTEELEAQNIRLEHTVEELQQAQDRLVNQEKLASLGALTAGIAHEIKNPLNFINNFAELSLQIDEELREFIDKLRPQIGEEETQNLKDLLNTLKTNIDKIYEHGKRADGIVRNMLQHSRGAPGEKILTDVNALLDEYVVLSYHGMRAQDVTFNIKIEKNYDMSLPKVPIVPQEISRVFLNLLNNAYYSTHQKKKQLKESYTPIVKVSTQNDGDFVAIKIWDNGQGIPNEVFPHLFTPFFTTKPTGEGTGLGLSLSYNMIVQGHNGTLIADSEPGEFAEFVVNLPLKSKHH
jgi:two-component system NtrC family sensor kinase